MGVELGSIDERRRPLIRISVAAGDSFLALVDTGFNGDLYMTERVAAALRLDYSNGKGDVELAGGRQTNVWTGRAHIAWLGETRTVDVFVAPDTERSRPPRDGDPVALAGTGLLYPHIVMLDFAASTVEIEQQ